MQWAAFVKQVRSFTERNKVGYEGSPFSGDLSFVESHIHELCHWVALGYALPRQAPEVEANDIIARVLTGLDRRAANANECLTIGAELNVLAAVYPGWTASHRRRLVAYAQRAIEHDGLYRNGGITPHAHRRFARIHRTRRAQRIAAVVLRAITNHQGTN